MNANAILLFLGFLLCQQAAASAVSRVVSAETLGVIVNINDPLSVDVAEYYQQQRGIPDNNIIRVAIPAHVDKLTKKDWRQLKAVLDRSPEHIQAYVATWSRPYKVACMSITTALSMGFDKKFCARGCQPTAQSAYFDSDTRSPYASHSIRPAMLLGADSLADAKALIDRGIASDFSNPGGAAYLVETRDRHRNTRAGRYPAVQRLLSYRIPVHIVKAEAIKNKHDVMFYFTGRVRVPGINSNTYLPGAIADHLTSAGGNLSGIKQMTILEWLRAGVTGSYGTVVEPCSYPQKFPDPEVVIRRYTDGETLIESYWKSVRWPGQGLFVGEPLARPFAGGSQGT